MKIHESSYHLEERFPQYSIRLWLQDINKIKLYGSCLLLILAIILYPERTCFYVFVILNILYFIVQLFRLLLLIMGRSSNHRETLKEPDELPIYTILIPIYKEDKVLKKLLKAIEKIDYPKALLDAKLLVEEDDDKTLEALKKITLPEFLEVTIVPVSYPRTKPKACNYGLNLAKGKYVVVYDAEDRPHPQQLKKAIAKFNISPPEVICIQARLNFYNKKENSLTKLFALEYSLLFDYILVGLKRLNMPIPLGGTSNHFIKEKLEEIGGWDAFNVTEDADVGIRLYHEGYRTSLIANTTLEESPISLKAWLIQRSRWIRGHLLTSLLHLKNCNKLKTKEMIGLYLCLYMPNLIYFLLPIYFLMRCFITESNEVDLLWQFNLLLGIILPMSYAIFIIITKKWRGLFLSVVLAVFYYWLLPIAGIRAFWQIFRDPFYWDKTEHGVSINYEE